MDLNNNIVKVDDRVLREKCSEVQKDYINLGELINKMFVILLRNSGVGLAAPQIGLPLRMFIIDTSMSVVFGKCKELTRKVMINPVVRIPDDAELVDGVEGCLSIESMSCIVSRYDKVVVDYYDSNFELHTNEEYTGLLAKIIQHENDHLDGILYTDRVSPDQNKRIFEYEDNEFGIENYEQLELALKKYNCKSEDDLDGVLWYEYGVSLIDRKKHREDVESIDGFGTKCHKK